MKCIIVDDERIACLGMKRIVEQHQDLILTGVFESVKEAVQFMETNPVDLIFLDIQMPEVTGIEFARQIPETTMVIFTTAYSEYAVDSYNVDAIDYLVKPIDPERCARAIDKARHYLNLISSAAHSGTSEAKSVSDYLIIKVDRRYVRLRFSNILFVEGMKDYVIIHAIPHSQKDANPIKVVTRQTIKGMEALLPSDMFLRVNKSYIVNTGYIDSFDTNDVLIGTWEIAIGATYRDAVKKRLLG